MMVIYLLTGLRFPLVCAGSKRRSMMRGSFDEHMGDVDKVHWTVCAVNFTVGDMVRLRQVLLMRFVVKLLSTCSEI